MIIIEDHQYKILVIYLIQLKCQKKIYQVQYQRSSEVMLMFLKKVLNLLKKLM